ncbi:hypothetical protein THARTR1_00923 [Trichoderma harzianum]|uniref:G domain-containing protein n=1 Tax=Trichoderma harzianum TaxID=5544 RepID=A0A2K0UNR3_TRIHA|nr:hypothetical protein THARTR1_00923 [Trichoderma harzianum]
MDRSVKVLPALGQDVELGMLYDVRTEQFIDGESLWSNDVVDSKHAIEYYRAENPEFTCSHSLDQARLHAGLDVERSLSLDLGIIEAAGSARYLSDKESSMSEARLDVTWSIASRRRRIPLEMLSSMQQQRELDDARFTHFVAEVTEGGSATLSFVQSCSSSENADEVLDELKAKILKMLTGGVAGVDASQDDEPVFKKLDISYSGEKAESISNIEDARRVARETLTKLKQQLNTLSYGLLPLTVLDKTAKQPTRSLDTNLVAKTAAALKAGAMTRLKLKDLIEQDVFQSSFPLTKPQISNIQCAFAAVETEFRKAARHLLPELRDGNTNYRTKVSKLQEAVDLFEQRTKYTDEFVTKKRDEAHVLGKTVASLLGDGFVNYLGEKKARLPNDPQGPRLLLSFGGASIGCSQHPLQKRIESSKIVGANKNDLEDSDDDDEDEDEDEDEEWFENQQTVANVMEACEALRRQRSLALPDVTFGVARVNKAYRPGKEKPTKTSIGDIVLEHNGKSLIVTGMLPTAPTAPRLTVDNQIITVTWAHGRDDDEERAIPTTGFIVCFRPQSNPLKDGAFPRASSNEGYNQVHCKASEGTVVIGTGGAPLYDDCDYEVMLAVKTIVGSSNWSEPVVGRTHRLPSVASEMIKFYAKNKPMLSRLKEGLKPWQLDESGGRKTLFLGLMRKGQYKCTDSRFRGEVAVEIVDVAAEFKPEIRGSSTTDRTNTIVVVFAGTSGHGKSTEINAFISYLLGGEPDDSARIMVIDDRNANQAQSVTQYVTCYCIRPLSPLFEGKTLVIVDTPGYGDSRGVNRDAFVTAAMSEFFKNIKHVNAIIFTSRANEARTTLLSPVSTYVFSLFAKDIKSCLLTIYTFSDAGAPLARSALRELKWPIDNGEVEVNNAAFTVKLDAGNSHKVRDWWLMSVKAQFQLMKKLLCRPPVSTAASADVTENRLQLESKCELVEKKIFQTANDAQNLISKLDALAGAVGAAPDTRVEVTVDRAVQKDVEGGQATTLCLDCNATCHKVCMYTDDEEKSRCSAIYNGNCTQCKGHCGWRRHKNARYIIVIEKEKRFVVPEDLIKHWNTNNNTLEGALLGAMDTYLGLQEGLRDDIILLVKLTEKLKSTALLHDPNAILNYVEILIKTARAQGAAPEQITQLTTAKKTLLLARELQHRGNSATLGLQTLPEVLSKVREEMDRRMRLKPRERAKEEKKSCSLYNSLRDELPGVIRKKAPEPLRVKTWRSDGALYPENLRAVVKLVRVILEDGGVVAELAAAN